MTDTNHTFNQFTDDIGHDYMVQVWFELFITLREFKIKAYDNTHPNNELSVSDHLISGTSEENAANSMIMHAYQVMEEGQETVMDSATPNVKPKAVHQCPTCNKIFVSYKGFFNFFDRLENSGLQQHTIIHTDQKPYGCDICGKSFRFKSNLFEHRSVHTNTNPHMWLVLINTNKSAFWKQPFFTVQFVVKLVGSKAIWRSICALIAPPRRNWIWLGSHLQGFI